MNKPVQHGIALAAKEHLLSGKPLTRMEAIILYGVANLPDVVKEMRKDGWIVKSRRTPYAASLVRLREHIEFTAPKNLPIREILFTEYWVSR